jgi:ComF family protein
MRAVQRAIASILGAARDFLFPPLCVSCDDVLDARHSVLCPSCAASLQVVNEEDVLYRESRERLIAAGTISAVVPGFAFEPHGPLQAALHRLKYGHCPAVGVELGIRLGERIAQRTAPDHRWVVIPVPLHRAKQRERGYNQAECICDGIVTILPWTVLPHALVRRRYTRSQTTLGRDERKRNVQGAFSVDSRFRDDVRDSSVILVDDVITTGATISECAAALVASGARTVVACSIALAP